MTSSNDHKGLRSLLERVSHQGRESLLVAGGLWIRHGGVVLQLAVGVMAVLALLKLGGEFHRLVLDGGEHGAIDLLYRSQEVRAWFAGRPVYGEFPSATYPPATYTLLWPPLAHGSVLFVRLLWALLSLACLVWTARFVLGESGATGRPQRILVALLPVSMNAAGVCIGNGQLCVVLMPLLLTALSTVRDSAGQGRWGRELWAALLMLVALAQPTLASPFFWIVLFLPGGFRVGSLVVSGYVGLTLLAAALRPESVLDLVTSWIANARAVAVGFGHEDIHALLTLLGLEQLALPASGLIITILGLFIWRHRRADFWLLLGTVAIVARLWTYHGLYDDYLILIPMLALYRLARQHGAESARGVAAGLLFAVTVGAMLVPARLHVFWEPPWPQLISALHLSVWLGDLAFLVAGVRRGGQRAA